MKSFRLSKYFSANHVYLIKKTFFSEEKDANTTFLIEKINQGSHEV